MALRRSSLAPWCCIIAVIAGSRVVSAWLSASHKTMAPTWHAATVPAFSRDIVSSLSFAKEVDGVPDAVPDVVPDAEWQSSEEVDIVPDAEWQSSNEVERVPDAEWQPSKEMYGIPHSGWQSPEWKWGDESGTAHECAAICRHRYRTVESRIKLVQRLLDSSPSPAKPTNLEEIKLVLALAWQQGRWDGTDGGERGYREVLAKMEQAEVYELGTATQCAARLVEDMVSRLPLLLRDTDNDTRRMYLTEISAIRSEVLAGEAIRAQRRCSGLVLQLMGFIDTGI